MESDVLREASYKLGDRVTDAVAHTTDIEGPRTSNVRGHRYFTLCSHGIKEEGGLIKTYPLHEAIERFIDQLKDKIEDNPGKVLVWRRFPAIDKFDSGYYSSARLAFVEPSVVEHR